MGKRSAVGGLSYLLRRAQSWFEAARLSVVAAPRVAANAITRVLPPRWPGQRKVANRGRDICFRVVL